MRVGADVLEGLEDGRWDGRRRGQVGAGGVEAGRVGCVGQLDELAVGGVVGVGAAGVVAAHARFLAGNAVGGLVLVLVAAVLLQVALVLPRLGGGVVGVRTGLDTGNGQGGDGKDDL